MAGYGPAQRREWVDRMRELCVSAGSLLVGDAVAHAVVRYQAVLARAYRTDVVEIPMVDIDGTTAIAELVLGPGITVLTKPAPDDELEPSGDGFIVDVEARIAVLQAAMRPEEPDDQAGTAPG